MNEMRAAYSTLDAQPEAAMLIECMRQTATWPAVVDLRAWSRPWLEVSDGKAVLDVGCGLADALVDLVRDRSDVVRAVGVDTSAKMLEQAAADARAAGVAIELHRADAAALPFPDGTFTSVRCERALQWVADPAAAITEMVRVLEPDGAAVLIDSDWRTAALDLADADLENLLAGVMAARPGAHVGGRLRRLALDAGLVDVQVQAATAVIAGWDPDEQEAPPGLVSPPVLARFLHEAGGVSQAEAQGHAAHVVEAARRGHFHMTLTMLAVAGRRPAAA